MFLYFKNLVFKLFKPTPPLLGRWCRVETHNTCNPMKKFDLANMDNSASILTEKIRKDIKPQS